MHDEPDLMGGTDANTLGSGGEPTEGYLDTPEGALFAIYHPPALGLTREHAVLLCDAFGSDRMNLHILYRMLAERLARAGFSVLRVDYAGTCDSSGYPRDCPQVSLWCKNLSHAADYLLARSGARAISAFGAALGGTLAVSLAFERDDVTHLALWSALGSGRAFLREASALDALKLPITRKTTLEHALLYGAGRIDTKLAERLRAQGAQVEIDPMAPALNVDILQRTGTRPQAGVIDTVTRWLERVSPAVKAEHASCASATGRTLTLSRSVVLRDPEGRDVRESVVRFGRNPPMLGIVTEPVDGDAHAEPILFVNGGLNHRCGINRNYTEWARRFAAEGHPVLRFDIRGLGDSVPDRDDELGVLYRDATMQDVREALAFLCSRTGASGCVCIGLCAGGYQSLQAAIIDRSVSAVVLMNPLRFRPLSPSVLLGQDRESDPGAFDRYAKTARDPQAWRRAIKDPASFRRLAERVLVAAEARARALFTPPSVVKPKASTWLASTFLELSERGCDVKLVLDDQDPIVKTIDERLSADRDQLAQTGRFSVDFISDTDHIFRPLVSQQEVLDILTKYLRARDGRDVQRSRPGARAG